MKKFLTLFSVVAVMLVLMSNSSCEDTNSNSKLAAQQEQFMQEANRQCGMPNKIWTFY